MTQLFKAEINLSQTFPLYGFDTGLLPPKPLSKAVEIVRSYWLDPRENITQFTEWDAIIMQLIVNFLPNPHINTP